MKRTAKRILAWLLAALLALAAVPGLAEGLDGAWEAETDLPGEDWIEAQELELTGEEGELELLPVEAPEAPEAEPAQAVEAAPSAFPIRIGNNHGSEGTFYEPLEQYILNMDSDKYYPDLAYMLAALSAAAYNTPGGQGGPLTVENAGHRSPSGELRHITRAYEDLGFADYQPHNYYNDPNDPAYGEDNAAFTIGVKPLNDSETLALIVVRGSYGLGDMDVSDWRSNLSIDTDAQGRHKGFAVAADRVYAQVMAFLNARYDGAHIRSGIRYVVTGHSRGAAVANLLAVRLREAGIANARVYDYNFACPDTAKKTLLEQWGKGHGNIFNVNHTADAVGVIPGILGNGVDTARTGLRSLFSSWGKYGATLFYCKDWNSAAEFDLARTFNISNSPHDYRFYVADLAARPTGFKTRGQVAARRVALNVSGGVEAVVKALYPRYAADDAPAKTDIAGATVTVKDQAYSGKALKPAVRVSLEGKKLAEGTDYSVSYKANKAVGRATVTVKGKGDYTGTATAAFAINPKKVKRLKLTPGKGRITVGWRAAADVTGYEIQCSLKSGFSSPKTVKVGRADADSKAIKGLKAGKTYYVRIRAYKKVDGKKYYSAWSEAKSVKLAK